MSLPSDLALTVIPDDGPVDAAPLRNNYAAIQTAVNAINDYLTALPDVAVLATGIAADYYGSSAPDGCAIEDGSAISRTDHADLYAIAGTKFGSGDGSTTFNLRDKRGRVSVGYAPSGGHTDVSTIGNTEGATLANRRPKHNTSITEPTGNLISDEADEGAVVTSGGGSNYSKRALALGPGGSPGFADTPAYVVSLSIVGL